MKSPLAESQRDALIEAMLPEVPFDGWSRAALRAAARRIGVPAAEALALFPDGPAAFVGRPRSSMSARTRPTIGPAMNVSPTWSVPSWTRTVATGPRPLSSFDSRTVPEA